MATGRLLCPQLVEALRIVVRIKAPAVLTTAGVFFILRTLRRAGRACPAPFNQAFSRRALACALLPAVPSRRHFLKFLFVSRVH